MKKVVHHAKYLDFGGTSKTAQLMCKLLLQSNKYTPYIIYRNCLDNPNYGTERLEIVRNILGNDRVISYDYIGGKSAKLPPYWPEYDTLSEVLKNINPDIVHIHRSGYEEFPGHKCLAPDAKWIETNIFGYADFSNNIDLSIYISNHIRNTALKNCNKDGPVIYNPVEDPIHNNKSISREYFINKYQLPENAFLCGRVGRPDNFDPISLKAFQIVQKKYNNIYYLVVSPCQGWINFVQQNKIENVIFIDPIINDFELSRLYDAIDLYLHSRSDGECCPVNIQDALIHGKTVVSHISPVYNGQSEILEGCGFVVPYNDFNAYSDVLINLFLNSDILNKFNYLSKTKAQKQYSGSIILKKLEEQYDKICT